MSNFIDFYEHVRYFDPFSTFDWPWDTKSSWETREAPISWIVGTRDTLCDGGTRGLQKWHESFDQINTKHTIYRILSINWNSIWWLSIITFIELYQLFFIDWELYYWAVHRLSSEQLKNTCSKQCANVIYLNINDRTERSGNMGSTTMTPKKMPSLP